MNREQSKIAAAKTAPRRPQRSALFGRHIFHAARDEQSRVKLDLRRSLRVHGRLALGVALLGFFLAAAYLLRYWPVYSAESVIYIQPAPAVQAGTVETHWPYNYDPATYESYVQQQMLSMTRPDVLRIALDKLQGFERNGETDQDAVERLGRVIQVEREGSSYEVTIRALADSAQMAADIANGLAASYIENTSRERRAGDAERIGILHEEADRVKKELEDDRAMQNTPNAGAVRPVATDKQKASDFPGEIARLQSRYDTLEEQIQNLLIEDAAPGTAHISNAAIAPAHPIADGVVKIAAIVLVAFLMLALLLAIAAHKLDPRIYVASDMEQILGFMPIAELPDFDEVPQDVFEEQLKRLAASVASALETANLKTCVFTGTGNRAGVTLIAMNVRLLIEGIGRPAVLVGDQEGRPAVWPGTSADEGELSDAEPLALVQRLTEEARLHDGMAVLADTAPLALSAETEYLVRNADCVVVVVESGETTRAELRATADALQRMDVGVVGYVLNRIALAKADAEFKESLLAIEGHLRSKRRRTKREPVRTRRVEAEPGTDMGPQSPELAERKYPDSSPMADRATAREIPVEIPVPVAGQRVRPFVEGPVADAGVSPIAEPAARAQRPVASVARQSVPPGRDKQEALPWWLADPVLHSDVPVQKHGVQEIEAIAGAETAPAEKGSRLSGLRQLFAERSTGREASGSREATVRESARTPANVPVQKDQEVAFFAAWEQAGPGACEPATERGSAGLPRKSTQEVIAVPEFLPPRTPGTVRRDEDAASRRDRRDTWDDVAVLPSWRGQYRRKE